MKKKFLVLAYIIYASGQVMAQDWKKNLQDAEAVYVNQSCEITIKHTDGKLSATRKIAEDLLVGTDNTVKMMSSGKIYHSQFNELKSWDAYTKLPTESKKMKVSNINTNSSRQDFIFYDDSKATSFDFSGITVGATRHISYELEHTDLHLLTPYYFDHYFPTQKAELKLVFPASVKLKYVIKGIHADKIRITESQKKDKNIYTFSATDIPALQYYQDAPEGPYYATHVIFYIEQTESKGQWTNFLSSPDDLYRYNFQYIKNINKSISTELKQLTDSLTSKWQTQDQKAKVIYKWVQSHIKYVAFEDGLEGFIPREANLVFARKYGDCKDMASILFAMLNHAGVPAYITWIGTRSLPYTYKETPLPIVDNHMICAVRIGQEYKFLDGTDESCVYGKPSHGIQGKEALVALDENKYEIVKVGIPAKEENKYIDSSLIEINEKEVKGRLKIYLKGYYSSALKSILNYRNESEKKEYLRSRFNRGNNKIQFKDWTINHSPDNDESWILAEFNLPDYARKINDEWLMNMNLFRLFEHQEIDFPKRKLPKEFEFLNTNQYTVALKIPTGYKISYIPESLHHKNDTWGFRLSYKIENDTLYLTQQFDTDHLLLQPSQFEQWNKILEVLFPHYKQSIVLSKK
jgi:hypothetical protein